MRASVVGLGYVGLPTAAVLASQGIEVIGVDVNQFVVDTINQGKTHFAEPYLDNLIQDVVQTRHLRAVMKPEPADVFIIAVPTPILLNNEPDLSYVKSAVKTTASILEKGNIVILESTSPVGTTQQLIEWMQAARPDLIFPEFGEDGNAPDISVAYSPERVLPGHVLRELVENNRIIGGVTSHCAERVHNFYQLFVEADCMLTDCRTAELCKLVENSFRDVNIAFANELSLISDKLDINVWELIKMANHHPRVNILQPGPGVGGHCIAVDPWFIVDSAPNESKLISTARLVNDNKLNFVLKKIDQAVAKTGKDRSELSVACFGLAFKPDIDDLRGSPALDIAQRVGLMGFAKQYVIEPNISQLPDGFDANRTTFNTLEEALACADIVVLLVDHAPFKTINLELLSGKQVVDTRGIWIS